MTGAVPEDLAELRLVGAPGLAPDGTWTAAAVQRVDPGHARYRSRLWRFAADGPALPLTPDEGAFSDTAPLVSPDATLVAFHSDRGGAPGVWLVAAGGGEPRRLEGPDARPVRTMWLDGGRLLTLFARPVAEPASAPVVVDWLRYKSDGARGPLEPTSELWVLTADGEQAPALVRSWEQDRLSCPVLDGDGGVYYAAHPRHSDELQPGGEVRRLDLATGREELVWRSASRVRALALTASGRPVALSSGAPGQSMEAPRVWWADEGRRVFPDSDLECERAVLADSRPQGDPALLACVGERILFVATVDGEVALYESEPGGEPRRVSPAGRSVVDFAAVGDLVALCLESATRPVELFLDGEQVSDLNTAWADRVAPVAPEAIEVTSADGLVLHGLLYRSAGAVRRDVLIRVHGGPHLAFGNAFDLETQVQVAAGFHVLVPGVRGGAGHGSGFRALSVGQWGRADFDDLTAFADWAVGSGTAAADRLFLAGGSYGGYLINWALTRTKRFRAAVSERSVSNLISKYGTSDNGFTVNRFEFDGLDLFDAGATELWERSPLRHAASVTTPLLLVHGESDQRCPIEQSEQFYAALRRLGREVVLARYPGASHGFTASGRPDHRVHRLGLILDWLGRHAA
jgi:dipeptidyl aminopeptidase/acylaminoacyl peptidase